MEKETTINALEQPIAQKPKMVNPYTKQTHSLGEGLTTQAITIDIGTNDYNFVKLIRPTQGTISATVCTLWQKLVETCKARGITDITDADEFVKLVNTCVLVPKDEYDTLISQAAEGNLPKRQAKAKKVTQ